MSVKKISAAELVWDEQGQPRSKAFGDLYFSAENGLEESRHVFLQGNQLQERWASLQENQVFVIAETGFGSGLNLLAAAALWNRTAPKTARLHFISTELFPMKVGQLRRILCHWPELSGLTDKLISQYPLLTPGFHRFELSEQISVTLIFDEVEAGLANLCPTLATELWGYRNWGVDAWFLDGFAPSQNPDMWSDQLFALINRLSSDSATIATFSCAGVVKRGLKEWGFSIEKVPGYGRKREMLTARREPDAPIDLERQQQNYRRVSPCWHLDARQADKPEKVAIIGAGIAGCTTAEALARRGIQSTLIDAGPGLASGASGNPQAALYARLSPDTGDLEDFCLHALAYARNYYAARLTDRHLGNLCGLVQLPRSDKEREKMQRLAERFTEAPELVELLQAEQLSEKAGLKIDSDGLWLPASGWVHGPNFNQSLLQRSGAELIANTRITAIDHNQGRFSLLSEQQAIGEFDAVILCSAMGTLFHPPASWLPIKPIRGQISFLENLAETQALKTVLCRETYLTPAYSGQQSVGATYELNTDNPLLKREDHQTNLDELQKLLGLNRPLELDIEQMQGRASTRTTTPDYLPMVGTLPSREIFADQYADWRKDRKRPISKAHQSISGLYLNLGYGSRGYVYAPLCAELLAAKIARQPEPVSMDMQRSLHPARFLLRSLSRNRRLQKRT